MYLFSRRIRIAPGNTRASMEWAIKQTELVNQITGLPVSLYSQVFSPEVGTLYYSTFVPDLMTLEAANDKLTVDEGLASATDKGAAFLVGGADDTVAQIVHGTPDPSRSIEYVSVVSTVCAAGNFKRGLEVGVEITDRAAKATGTPGLFASMVTGNYGTVGWITAFESIQALEAGEQALAADASFLEFIDKEASTAFSDQAGSTTQLVLRKIV